MISPDKIRHLEDSYFDYLDNTQLAEADCSIKIHARTLYYGGST